jgi:AcrR family transcriptional regulator
LSNPVRVAPQQERSTRRLAGFLDAVAELFVEVSYEAATTTAVAERIGSSIGALYNYFPDKQSIAFTLVNQYSQEVEAHWKPLMEQAEILTHAEFADRFIERITQFVQERPAYLILLVAKSYGMCLGTRSIWAVVDNPWIDVRRRQATSSGLRWVRASARCSHARQPFRARGGLRPSPATGPKGEHKGH